MLQRVLLLSFSIAVASTVVVDSLGLSQRRTAAPYSDNQCVNCHAGISQPIGISRRYLDWHFSKHKTEGVGCDNCHGGDAASRDAKKAHKGVINPSQNESRLSLVNLPETCGSCHKAIVNSFVESVHYKKLKLSGLGPSCNTCHTHMASTVATHPKEASTYCTFCHNSINGLLPQRPEIPAKAQRLMESLGRASYGVKWVQELLKEAQQRKLSVAEQIEDLRLLEGLVYEAKIGWHALNLDGVQVKADKAFEESARIRQQLMKKLGKT